MATSLKNLSDQDLEGISLPSGLHVALVVSEWNDEITSGLLEGAMEVLALYSNHLSVHIHHVPGSFELPMGAQWAFEYQDVNGVICIGNVIRGETAHFDFVCQATTEGILKVGLAYDRPCIFCVLTDDTIEQSRARSGGEHGNKGTEAAAALLKMLSLKESLVNPQR
ncbi:MAG: 6,7-dimethyl-8-ribityllumazine synthase [Bacteroidetes bacterium]|jgi:6,7-dimethyl-8-ribityllumazine synthase|nr:6,7-dimethyl-8-ribityllumazine synthase [Bacteroidota bacterium]